MAALNGNIKKEKYMRTRSLSLVLFLIVFAAPSAWAHEHRDVAGKFMFKVGFVKEPAFAGEMNGIDIYVTTLGNKKPVEGVEGTLHVTVLREDQKRSVVLSLRPKYKEPGRYAGYFLPTRSGAYVFIFEGAINGTPIHEKFESAKGKFHDVEEPVQFP
jgi:hypothetical protein